MKFLIALSSCLLVSSWSPAATRPDGGAVSNGGGIAEAHIAYAFATLDRLTDVCAANRDCAQTDSQIHALTAIVEATKEERVAHRPAFKAEHEDPGFFVVDGIEQEFRTEPQIGATLYYNLDKIYVSTGRPNEIVSRSLNELIALTLRSFAAHVPHELSDDELLGLSLRLGKHNVANIFEAHFLSMDFLDRGGVAYAEKSSRNGLPSVLISNYDEVYNLSPRFHKAWTRALIRNGENLTFESTRITQLRWSEAFRSAVDYSARLTFRMDGKLTTDNGILVPFRCDGVFLGAFCEKTLRPC